MYKAARTNERGNSSAIAFLLSTNSIFAKHFFTLFCTICGLSLFAQPSVVSVNGTSSLITDSDNGSSFTITVTYDTPMDSGTEPTISFPNEDPTSTLSFESGSWSSPPTITYQATYIISDADQDIVGVDVLVEGALGVDPPSEQQSATFEDVFDINMGVPIELVVESISLVSGTFNPTNAETVVWQVDFSTILIGSLSQSDFQVNVESGDISGFSISDPVQDPMISTRYLVSVSTGTGDGTISLQMTEAAGTDPPPSNLPFTGESVEVIKSHPFLQVVTIFGDNDNPFEAVEGDLITVGIAASDDIQNVSAEILGNTAIIDDLSDGNETTWQATYTVQSTDDPGIAAFTINFQDLGGTDQTPVTATTDGTFVTVVGTGVPEIDVLGDAISIPDGSTTTSVTNNTDFGTVEIGSNRSELFGISNDGTIDLTVSDISSDNSLFTLDQTSFTVTPSGFVTFNIIFTPTETGVQFATISIANDDSDENPYTFVVQAEGVESVTAPEILVEGFEAIDILSGDVTPSTTDGTDFGEVVVGQSSSSNTFLIENEGDATLNISDVISSNTMFSLTIDISAVEPGGSESFEITFSPTETGVQTSTISISNNDSDEDPYTFLVQGEGISESTTAPEINVEGANDNSIASGDDTPSTDDGSDLGLVAIESSATQTFTIQNLGDATLTIEDINSSNSLFEVSISSGSILSGESLTFEVTFTPTETGTQTTTITISNDDSDESSYTFTLSAQGSSPEITVIGDNDSEISDGSSDTSTEDGTNFGDVTIGESLTQVFTISNTGDAELSVSSISSSNELFAVNSEIETIAAGDSEVFELIFTPTESGTENAEIAIESNDVDESTFNFQVQGEGKNPPGEIIISSESISGTSLIPGARDILIYKMVWEIQANSIFTDGFYIEFEGSFNQSDFEGIELLFNKEFDNIGAAESLGVGSFDPSPENAPETSYGWLFTETLESGELIYFYLVADIDGTASVGTTFKVTDFTESNFGLGDAIIDLQTDNGPDFIIVEAGANQDSLALVALHNATSGDDWTNNDNWLTGNLETWFGITLTEGRITQINLPDNNLTGEVPEDLATISELASVDLSGNDITRIPGLSTISSLNTLNVSGNRLQFGDIERNVGITTFNYQDQGLIGEVQTEPVLVRIGNDFVLRLPIDGSGNNYSWSRRNANGTFEVSTTPNVNITNINFENMGEFTLTVTSDVITDLTLVSQPREVFATAVLSGIVTGINDAPLDEGVMDALNIPFDGGAYDSLDQVDVSNGDFSFGELILGDYVCATRGEETIYLPTYFGNTDLWTEADTIFLRNDLVIGDYVMQQLPGETEGPAEIGLLVESNFAEERSASARIAARRKLQKVGCSLRRRRRATGGRPQNDEFELVAYKETDENGEVQFENLPADTYRLNIEYPGIPMDPDSFIEFEVGEEGTNNNSLSLAATVDEEGITVELVEALGFYQPEFDNLRVYPNPTAEYVTLRFGEVNNQNLQVIVSDIEGKTLKMVPLETFANEARVDLRGLKEGVYLLQVVGEKDPNRAIFRIIIRQ